MHFTYCTFLLFLSTNKKHDSYDYKYQRLFLLQKLKDNEALVQHKIIFNKENQILYQCANIGFSFSLKILWAMFVSQKWSEMKICLKHATFTWINVYEKNDLQNDNKIASYGLWIQRLYSIWNSSYIENKSNVKSVSV